MKKIFLTTIAIAGFCILFGQQNSNSTFDKLTDFLPPAPNAASIIKYGNLTINKNTGTPNISIPLFSLKGKKLGMAVSLGYSSNGVKVDEIASRVGMGWSIQAGGVITRTVRGAVDEWNTRHYPYATIGFNHQTYSYMKRISESSNSGVQNGYDAEPDLFNFNFNGYSGSFVFDENMVIQQVSKSPIKIQSDLNSTNPSWSFKVTTPDGVCYYFGGAGATEKTKREQTCGKSFAQFIPTAWYLTKIQHPNGEQILLTYLPLNYRYDNGVSQTMYKVAQDLSGCGANTYMPASTCINVCRTEGFLLHTIQSPGYGSIGFTYMAREDCEDQLISKIILSDYNGTSSAFDFTYNTITAMAGFTGQTYSGYNKTPYLISITEINADNSEFRSHLFSYKNPQDRAPRLSFAQDHWGYFNGKNNLSLTPNLGGSYTAAFPDALANKESDFESASKGILTKIVYPTGGVDMITYESNASTGVGEYSTLHQKTCNVTGTGNWNEVIRTDNFYSIGSSVELIIHCIDNSGNGSFDSLHNNGKVRIKNSNGTVIFGDAEVYTPGTITNRLVNLVANQNYTIEIIANGSVVTNEVTLKYHPANTSDTLSTVGPGLRVKSVFTGNPNEKPTTKKYFYGLPGSLNVSTLSWIPAPNYLGQMIVARPCPNIEGQGYNYHYQTLNSNSINSLFNYQGAPISYTSIVESFGENFEGGGIHSTFMAAADVLGVIMWGNDIINSPLCNLSSFFNAKPVSETVLKKAANGSLMPVKKTEYTYKDDQRGEGLVYGYNVVQKTPELSTIDTLCDLSVNPTDFNSCANQLAARLTNYDMVRYMVYRNWVYPEYITETLYDENGQNPLANTTKYYYENEHHLQLTKTETYTSKNELLKTENKYPHDYDSIAVYADMIAKNIVTPIIDVKTSNGSIVTAEVKNTYANVGNNNTEIVLIESSLKGNALETEGTIDVYDADGNILQYTGKNGITTSIVWGYGNKYPVAKISGATYSSVIAQLSISVAALQYLDGAALRTELNHIRTGLSTAMVTTYTYKHMTGITSITDPNNKTNTYEYDAFNRLTIIKDQDNNVVKKNSYVYALNNSGASPAIYFNQPITKYFTCVTCISGFTGNELAYSIPFGKYFSLLSQADADAQANADVEGQLYANKNGLCANNICNGEGYKFIGCNCELGTKVCDNSYLNSYGNWVNTYHYHWSDGTNSQSYTTVTPPCVAVGYKHIGCDCVLGMKIYTSSVYDKTVNGGNGGWVCTYHYHWPDNTNSQDYTEVAINDCMSVMD